METIIQDTQALKEAVGSNVEGQADAAIIWLHGLGADGGDFVSAVPYLKIPKELKVRFVFPTAPIRAVTINNGMQMRSWYDIKAMLPARVTDEEQLLESVGLIGDEIEALKSQGFDESKIIVIGFSQGGAVAYELALTSGAALLGVAAMSTYLPRSLSDEMCKADKRLSMLVIHGDRDDVVPCALGEKAIEQLRSLGYAPKWNTYPMAHEVSLPSLTLLGEWITQKITS